MERAKNGESVTNAGGSVQTLGAQLKRLVANAGFCPPSHLMGRRGNKIEVRAGGKLATGGSRCERSEF